MLALAGDPEAVAAARETVLGPGVTPAGTAAAEPFLFCASPPYSEADEKRLRHADLLVSLPGGPGVTDFRPADTVQVACPEAVREEVLTHRPDLRVSLARRLPGFRPLAAEGVIREVSRVNAEFATLSGISDTLPFLTPLFPAVAGADILVLTKNQVLMVFRLAAIYGEDLDLKSRAREVAPIIGGAFGWRSIARELLRLIPGGLGCRSGPASPIRTYAVGRAAQMVFDEGRRPTRQEMLRIYEESAQRGRDFVGRLRGRRRGGENSGEQLAALPPPPALAPPAGSPEREAAGPEGIRTRRRAGGT